jgi:hypothetical protein
MRQDVDVREVRTVAQSNRASCLWLASSSGASIGPAGVAEAGRSGVALTARSTKTSASILRMTIRQNVSLSWIRCADQPRWLRPPGHRARRERARTRGAVKKSRSSVRRAMRCCASRAAPPASKKALAGRQGEEQPGHLQLESRQVRLAVAHRLYASASLDAEINGAHADRIPRGRTRPSQRSTSSMPST